MNDPYSDEAATSSTLGLKGGVIAPSDGSDLAPIAKAVVVTDVTAGADLVVLPAGNEDGAWVPFHGVSVGFVPPFRVRRVSEDSTAVVAAVWG
ncbi:hypothetical protein PSM7751_02924 [Pseudooceanicola marinus]|uniref:Uncharacterized protein n=1 Tax=Pseudooceanicola marinus TaxID=396013 RepID=A0A1X6ZRH9_9RHOB|nr:hypothetical protein [Pseudooceanicola marinus]PJE30732.1 hypothetical protein CVM50_10900 [Pseudooceanicola marinus]SLN59111.1 hypothetical protein PSM7751_02924 [Pseudooceanicola marinus]